jgi:hypothetical protein
MCARCSRQFSRLDANGWAATAIAYVGPAGAGDAATLHANVAACASFIAFGPLE